MHDMAEQAGKRRRNLSLSPMFFVLFLSHETMPKPPLILLRFFSKSTIQKSFKLRPCAKPKTKVLIYLPLLLSINKYLCSLFDPLFHFIHPSIEKMTHRVIIILRLYTRYRSKIMIPETIGRNFDVTKVAKIKCVKNDSLTDLDIEGHCFLMLIVHKGSAYFQVGSMFFEAIAPCLVCFDETEQPKLINKYDLQCDSIYFHPMFLNVNMTFEQVHSNHYEQLALRHDMFLLKPFTDKKSYVFPLFAEYTDRLDYLFLKLETELTDQNDWYWSCRSRSFFLEIILILERIYGIIGYDDSVSSIEKLTNPHLKNAVIYIESHYAESITLESISKTASMNHSTLTHLFKTELGITPIEYLWQRRIIVAKKHLEFTNLPVNDISIRCGFKTVQHFSRKFKEATNLAPKAFRDMAVSKRKAAF